MSTEGSLSIANAWNTVALEERLELLARAHASGFLAAFGMLLLCGCIGWGFDQIWILGGGAIGALMVMPMFASYSWRRNKPNAILSYLAARSVARRYAYGLKVSELDTVLIFRGYIREIYNTEEEQRMADERQLVDFNPQSGSRKQIWICLLRGALICLSEHVGGARLEFSTSITHETGYGKPDAEHGAPENAFIVKGMTGEEERQILVWSDYPAALYVFEKQFSRLVDEAVMSKRYMDEMATAEAGTLGSVGKAQQKNITENAGAAM